MNKSIIALLSMLIRFMSAVSTTASFELQTTYHLLNLFEHIDFNLVFHRTTRTGKSYSFNSYIAATDYTCNFWSEYQQKFARKEYVLRLITRLNGNDYSNIEALLESDKYGRVSPLTMINFEFPEECESDENISSKLVDIGWQINQNELWEKTMKLDLICQQPEFDVDTRRHEKVVSTENPSEVSEKNKKAEQVEVKKPLKKFAFKIEVVEKKAVGNHDDLKKIERNLNQEQLLIENPKVHSEPIINLDSRILEKQFSENTLEIQKIIADKKSIVIEKIIL